MVSVIFFAACKESDSNSISLLPADGGNRINELILYRGNTATTDGNLGGRVGVNNLCQSSVNKPNDKMDFIGFISIDGTSDTIGSLPMNNDFPGNVPIKSKTGKIVAFNWDELMGPPLNSTLASLEVLAGGTTWWSGGKNGGDAYNTCDGFVDGTSFHDGRYGSADSTTDWVELAPQSCSNLRYYLCLAF